MDKVAEWCRIEPGGACLWQRSIDGLHDALQGEVEVTILKGEWESICEAVEVNGEPVLVQIGNPNPLVELVGFHAVVIVGIEEASGGDEQVKYMDPSSGTIESMSLVKFLDWWAVPDQDAFLLR